MSTLDPTYGGIEFGLHADAGLGEITVTGVIDNGRYRYVIDEAGTLHGPYEGDATAVPLQLAEIINLGPRDTPGDDARVLFVETELLEGAGREALAGAWDDELREGTPMAGEGWLYWSAWASWSEGGETVVDGITVIDGGGDGIAAVQEVEGGVIVQPCTTTQVWFELCGLLPRTSELAGTPAGGGAG